MWAVRIHKNVCLCVIDNWITDLCDPFKTRTHQNKANMILHTLMRQLTYSVGARVQALRFRGCRSARGMYVGFCECLFNSALEQTSEPVVFVCAHTNEWV